MRVDIDNLTEEEANKDGGRLLIIAALQSLPYAEYLFEIRRLGNAATNVRFAGIVCGRGMSITSLTTIEGGSSRKMLPHLCPMHHQMWHDNWVLKVQSEGRKQFADENTNDKA